MFKKTIIISIFAVAFLFSSATLTHAALTTAQINAIIGLLQSFGADQSVIDNVRVSLTGGTPSTTTTTEPTSSCTQVNLKSNLYLGLDDSETGGEVTKLQKFLSQDPSVYPEGLITGYFGPMTERAVQKWQAKHGVVSSGTPDTTGYGVVGPKTRERITEVCGGTSSSSVVVTPVSPTVTQVVTPMPTVPQPVVPTQPFITVLTPNGGEIINWSSPHTITLDSNGIDRVSIALYKNDSFFSKIADSNNYYVKNSYTWTPSEIIPTQANIGNDIFKIHVTGYTIEGGTVEDESDAPFSIVISQTNLPPTISDVSGPTTLNVGQTGTWTVTASDPESGLNWLVDWGDGNVGTTDKVKASGTQQIGTFTYTYTTSGTYSPTLIVTDNTGQQAKTSISVNVVDVTQPSITVLTPNGGEVYKIGDTVTVKWNSSSIPLDALIRLGYWYSPLQEELAQIDLIENSGIYNWTIPSNFLAGNNYKIGIEYRTDLNKEGVDASDKSDAPFSIE